MGRYEDLKQLYQTAKTVGIGEALQLIREAESEDEQAFYAFILNQHFQRRQNVAIEQHLF